MKQTIAMLFFFLLALASCQESNSRKEPKLSLKQENKPFIITMDVKSSDVKSILLEIQSQTGLGIVALPGALDGAKNLTINVKNKPLDTFLKEDFCKNQPFNFQIRDSNSIVISRKASSEVPISLKVKNAEVHDVLKIIQKQTSIGLSYPPELLDDAKKVTITVTNSSLDSVMRLVCKRQRFTYSIDDDQLLILKPLVAVTQGCE
jgi:hypothetical protein